MKHNWEYKTFGSLCNIVRGGSPRPIQDYLTDSAEGLNWIKIGDVAAGSKYIIATKEKIKREGLVKTRQVFKGDFILSNSMSFGRPYILKIDGCIHDGWLAIKGVENHFIPDFLYYYLSAPSTYSIFEKLVRGGVVSNLNSDIVKGIDVPLPTIDMQRQIVAELDKINEVIEDCRELLRNLDSLAQSLFYDTFGDPITNPKGWPIDKLGNLLIIERGGSPRPIKEYITQDEDGINWIKIGDANSSMYISSTKEKIKPSGKSKSRFVKPGDFILSNSMSFGRPYIMNTYGCIHDGWLLLRDNNNFFNKIYLYYCLNSKSIYSEFERLVRTGTVSNLNSDIVRGVKIPVPPLAHQEKFAERIEQIEEQKKVVENTIAELQTLLDSRMDYWFN